MTRAAIARGVEWRGVITRTRAVLTIAGLVVAIAMASGLIDIPLETGFDARIWWLARLPEPYRHATYEMGTYGYFYSPAFAQAVALLNWLPWEAFLAIWGTMSAVAIVALAGPWTLIGLSHPQGTVALLSGNAQVLIYLAVAVGFRHPWAWAFVLLTKVTPGVGLIWFAMRRQWRHLAIALGATAGVVAVSLVSAPHLWLEWVQLLQANVGRTPGMSVQVPFFPRLIAAAALVAVGARTERPQTVPVAAWLAQPAIWDWGVVLILPAFIDWSAWRRIMSRRRQPGGAKIQPSSSS